MTSLGKCAYTCMYRNSHMVYERNTNYWGGAECKSIITAARNCFQW